MGRWKDDGWWMMNECMDRWMDDGWTDDRWMDNGWMMIEWVDDGYAWQVDSTEQRAVKKYQATYSS